MRVLLISAALLVGGCETTPEECPECPECEVCETITCIKIEGQIQGQLSGCDKEE